MRPFNIIKRTLSHHHSPTSFTKFPVSSFINHIDKEKVDETNKNVLDLVSKVDIIDNKINSINTKVKNTDTYLFIHLVIMHSIYMPIILYNI
jgi:peptidoglycan hydrolase CwlO-like protein